MSKKKATPMPQVAPAPVATSQARKPIQVMLSPEERAVVEVIQSHFGFTGAAQTIRFAITQLHRTLPATTNGDEKK